MNTVLFAEAPTCYRRVQVSDPCHWDAMSTTLPFIINCPSCGTRVIPTTDNRCPQCHADVQTGKGSVQRQNTQSEVWWSLQGRIGRGSFWGRIGLLLLLNIVVDSLLLLLGEDPDRPGGVFLVLKLLTIIVTSWLGFATSVKRWHDLNRPRGWCCST